MKANQIGLANAEFPGTLQWPLEKNKDGKNEVVTFVHVFENCNQDSGTVVAILDDVFKQLASIALEISTIYLRQDNAGCYHSASTLLAIQQVATRNK